MKKVFVIEDDQDILEAIRMILNNKGFTVETSDDLINLKEIAVFEPDLILSDLSLKNKNGGSFVRDIKADEKIGNIPLVIISGQSLEIIMGIAKELKISGYLQKPFNMEDLVNIVEKNTG